MSTLQFILLTFKSPKKKIDFKYYSGINDTD